MAAEAAWPPKSPRAALLSSPTGRRKYLSNHYNVQRSPLKHPATTPPLLDRLRAARANNDYFDPSEPVEEEDDDEETLKLQLAAIEAKLKLKRLQQSRSRTGTPHSVSCNPPSANDVGKWTSLSSNGTQVPQQSRSNHVVGVSPTKKLASIIEPKSPNRILLGIDKGFKGADVSLRRAKSTLDSSRGAAATTRPASQISGHSSHRSTTSVNNGRSITSFSERMSSVRDRDKSKEAQRRSALIGRSTGFNTNQAEVDSYHQLAEEQPKQSSPPVPLGPQNDYSREDIIRAKEKARAGSIALQKSGTAPNFSRSPTRPASRGPPQDSTCGDQSDASMFEAFSGLHLASRILPHSFMKRTLPKDRYTVYRIPDLLREVKSPEYELSDVVGDYVVFGAIASKSTPRDHKQKVEEKSVGSQDWERKWEDGSQNHRKFMVMTLTDLDWSLDLYFFGTAVPRYHRLTPGTVVAILNPSIMPPKHGKEDTGAFSLTLHDGDDTILEIGTAKHLGHCNAQRKDGKECGQWINATKTEICEWHLNLELSKTQSSRMGLNTGTNGTKLNNRSFLFDSRTKGNGEGEGRKYGLHGIGGKKYDSWTESSYYVSNSNPGFSARAQQISNGGRGRLIDLDDRFIEEGRLDRDKKTLLKLRKERQQKEEDIAKKLSTFEGGRAGSQYLRHRTAAVDPSGSSKCDTELGTLRSGVATKANIMRSRIDTNESRKRAADSVRLSPVKKTRFITEKGIREAGRESLGFTNVDEDDDLDIV